MSTTQPLSVQNPAAPRVEPFSALVRNEVQATWQGRYHWLWTNSALLVEVLIIGMYAPPINGIHALQGVTSNALGNSLPVFFLQMLYVLLPPVLVWTGAAALGADLLSLQYRENPEPHRQWHPREFLARAVGRWVPWLCWSGVWLFTWTGMELWAVHWGRIFLSARSPVPPLPLMGSWQETAILMVMLLLFTLPFAAVAALLSAASRRPRRGRMTLATWVVILLLGVGNQLLAFQLSALDYRSGLLYDQLLWAAETIAAASLVWWIARGRYRRHPYTALPEVDGRQPVEEEVRTPSPAAAERTGA